MTARLIQNPSDPALPVEVALNGWALDVTAEDDRHAELFLYGRIGGGGFFSSGISAEDVAKDLAELDADTITVYIQSPGGSAFDGVAIYNALLRHKATVTTVVDGMAASAASVIFMAGQTRRMGVGAQVMIHEASAGQWGRAVELRASADLLDEINVDLAELYAAVAGGDADEWMEAMTATTWYRAAAAVEAGLATELVKAVDDEDGDEEEDEAASAAFKPVTVADALQANPGAVGPDDGVDPYIPTADDPEPEGDEDESEDDEDEPSTLADLTMHWGQPAQTIADMLTDNNKGEAAG